MSGFEAAHLAASQKEKRCKRHVAVSSVLLPRSSSTRTLLQYPQTESRKSPFPTATRGEVYSIKTSEIK